MEGWLDSYVSAVVHVLLGGLWLQLRAVKEYRGIASSVEAAGFCFANLTPRCSAACLKPRALPSWSAASTSPNIFGNRALRS